MKFDQMTNFFPLIVDSYKMSIKKIPQFVQKILADKSYLEKATPHSS